MEGIEARKVSLTAMLILAIVLVLTAPVGYAANNVHTFYLGSSSVGTCGGKCEGFTTTSGTADTGTSQSISIGSAPVLDSNANAKRTGTWSSGNTFTITGFSTTSSTDA